SGGRTNGRSRMMMLEDTRRFWNDSPCGAQDSFSARVEHRYAMEPWISATLTMIAARHRNVLEIGCGQGTDGLLLCSLLPRNGRYLGLDYSDFSIEQAQRAGEEARKLLNLHIEPQFRWGNAESLALPPESVDCVYSCGVLHHTPDTERAIAEIYRVLRPSGEAYVSLYRKPSLKVGIAQALRLAQTGLDAVTHRHRTLYHLLRERHWPNLLGTMVLECFGVPILKWYSHNDVMKLFAAFRILRLDRVGYNLPFRNPSGDGKTRWGYMWLAHIQKQPAIREGSK